MIHLPRNVSIEESQRAGYQAGLHGSDTTNSHFSWFATPELTSAWERGNKQGKIDAAVARVRGAKNCKACAHSYMEPDADLTCGHPDSGPMGLYCHRKPPDHCGPTRTKFSQHPLRNPDGTLKP